MVLHVLTGDEDKAHIRFMQNSGDVFIWPGKDDTGLVFVSQIICTLQPPAPVKKRNQFMFEDLDNVKRTLAFGKTTVKFK